MKREVRESKREGRNNKRMHRLRINGFTNTYLNENIVTNICKKKYFNLCIK